MCALPPHCQIGCWAGSFYSGAVDAPSYVLRSLKLYSRNERRLLLVSIFIYHCPGLGSPHWSINSTLPPLLPPAAPAPCRSHPCRSSSAGLNASRSYPMPLSTLAALAPCRSRHSPLPPHAAPAPIPAAPALCRL